jgi:hypothetical protein
MKKIPVEMHVIKRDRTITYRNLIQHLCVETYFFNFCILCLPQMTELYSIMCILLYNIAAKHNKKELC